MCASASAQDYTAPKQQKTAHDALTLDSDTCVLRIHNELSIRALWIIFFRTQGGRTVTLERFAGAHLDLCARLPMYKVALFGSLKTTSRNLENTSKMSPKSRKNQFTPFFIKNFSKTNINFLLDS